LSSLTILASALGIGLGVGLQNIAKNFGSGLIISRVNSPPLGAHEKSKKELQYPAACCGVVYSLFLNGQFRWGILLKWVV
jgi:hypothetical protein